MALATATAMTIAAGAAVGSLGLAAYNTFNQPKAPPAMPPPQPASYYSYDEEGNPAGQQVWDASRNAYVYKPRKLTDEELREQAQRRDLRNKHLAKLLGEKSYTRVTGREAAPLTPEQAARKAAVKGELKSIQQQVDAISMKLGSADSNPKKAPRRQAALRDLEARRSELVAELDGLEKITYRDLTEEASSGVEGDERAYDEYARAFTGQLQKHVDERYKETKRATEEELNATGQYGSSAYVDRMTRLDREKLEADTDVGQRAILAKEELRRADQDFSLRTIAELDAGRRSDALIGLERELAATRTANLGSSALMAGYTANQDARLKQWAVEMERSRDISNKALDTATGLAFLYGYPKAGGLKTPKGQEMPAALLPDYSRHV